MISEQRRRQNAEAQRRFREKHRRQRRAATTTSPPKHVESPVPTHDSPTNMPSTLDPAMRLVLEQSPLSYQKDDFSMEDLPWHSTFNGSQANQTPLEISDPIKDFTVETTSPPTNEITSRSALGFFTNLAMYPSSPAMTLDSCELSSDALFKPFSIGGPPSLTFDSTSRSSSGSIPVQRPIPLLLAAERGHEAVVKKLLDMGANIHAVDMQQRSALHIATIHGRLGVLSTLLSKNANVHAIDEDGFTSLDHAAGQGFEAGVELLCRFGARLD